MKIIVKLNWLVVLIFYKKFVPIASIDIQVCGGLTDLNESTGRLNVTYKNGGVIYFEFQDVDGMNEADRNVIATNITHFSDNGYFKAIDEMNRPVSGLLDQYGTVHIKNAFMPTGAYCLQRSGNDQFAITLMRSKEFAPVRKCCPKGTRLKFAETTSCQRNEYEVSNFSHWPIYERPGVPSSLEIGSTALEKNLVITIAPASCSNPTVLSSSSLLLEPVSPAPFILLRKGGVMFYDKKQQKWLNNMKKEPDYCYDRVEGGYESQSGNGICGSSELDVLLICLDTSAANESSGVDAHSYQEKTVQIIYLVSMMIAMLFLLLTCLVHFLLWEKQNLHSWILTSYVISQLVFYLLLFILRMDVIGWIDIAKKSAGCLTFSILTHFFGIMTFCWLSVINFDLWWTFRNVKPTQSNSFDLKTLTIYSAFPWLTSTSIIVVSIILDSSKSSSLCRSNKGLGKIIYPQYADEICFLSNSSKLYFFYGPIGALLLLNLAFFLTTTGQMFKFIMNRQKKLVKGSARKYKQSWVLFVKLFTVMGITWIFEVAHYVGPTFKNHKWIWLVLDMSNIFQAVALFIIFVCKRETIRSLEQSHPRLKGFLRIFKQEEQTVKSGTDGSGEASTRLSRIETSRCESTYCQENIELH